MAARESCSGAEVGGVALGAGGRLRCQRRVSGVRCPVRTMVSAKETVTVEASKATWQPASHSCPMEISDLEASAGTMWTWRAAGGRPGTSSSASCVECMMEPLGFRIEIGSVVGRRWRTGKSTVQKCAVLPVSAMAGASEEKAGGPSGAGAEDEIREQVRFDDWSNLSAVASRGFPRS